MVEKFSSIKKRMEVPFLIFVIIVCVIVLIILNTSKAEAPAQPQGKATDAQKQGVFITHTGYIKDSRTGLCFLVVFDGSKETDLQVKDAKLVPCRRVSAPTRPAQQPAPAQIP